MLTRDDVLAAQERIRGHVRRTPVIAVDPATSNLWLKCEFLQLAGVFKTRGAVNRILTGLETGTLDPAIGVVAASGGNAGLAHAYAAARVGVAATVFVPQTAPAVKVARLREYGATVRQVGQEYAEAYLAAVDFAGTAGALFCHAYDQPEIAAGAGTIGEEILTDVPDVDTIVVAVGGGGLFAGIAAAAEGRARVVAVEPERIPTLHSALQAGQPVDVAVSGVAADSLGARRIGSIAFDVARRTRPVSVLVDDEAILAARTALWQDHRMAVEHGAAAAYAGLTSNAYRPAPDERVAVVICGANTDPGTLA
ncbi:threonine/serine dehydratase [Cellulomonas sp. NS3]|uniref:threonine/serine dehydratase n=1 Tax=Cellulomonas sp. NS3 TaxID=2973977 RepID=UPI002161897B|nr:threonine/serine dehydratase [Cellulomonas sp. NS3]